MAYYDFTARPLTGFTAPSSPARPKWTWGEQMGQEIINPQTAPRLGQLGQRLSLLPGEYQPRLRGINADARRGLAGYGGVTWGTDDPATPEDESLNVRYETGKVGERETQAVNRVRWGANARGMLHSSFTDQNVGDALNQVAEEARGVITQYGKQINDTIDSYFREGSDVVSEIGSLYGQDAAYYANPDAPWMKAGPAQSVVPRASTPTPKRTSTRVRGGRVAF